MRLLQKLRQFQFVKSDEGSTAVEYSVMVALIIIACIGAVRGMGGENGSLWTSSLETIQTEFAKSEGGGGDGG